MTPDEIHDYEYELRNARARVNGDPTLRVQDRKLLLAFMAHIKALGVSIGRQVKYANMLMAATRLLRVPWRQAKRKDREDLMVKLADHEIRNKRMGEVRHYSAETMADFHMVVKRFQKFVRYGDTDKEAPYPDEVRMFLADMAAKLSYIRRQDEIVQGDNWRRRSKKKTSIRSRRRWERNSGKSLPQERFSSTTVLNGRLWSWQTGRRPTASTSRRVWSRWR